LLLDHLPERRRLRTPHHYGLILGNMTSHRLARSSWGTRLLTRSDHRRLGHGLPAVGSVNLRFRGGLKSRPAVRAPKDCYNVGAVGWWPPLPGWPGAPAGGEGGAGLGVGGPADNLRLCSRSSNRSAGGRSR
jgi:hypothetical protein